MPRRATRPFQDHDEVLHAVQPGDILLIRYPKNQKRRLLWQHSAIVLLILEIITENMLTNKSDPAHIADRIITIRLTLPSKAITQDCKDNIFTFSGEFQNLIIDSTDSISHADFSVACSLKTRSNFLRPKSLIYRDPSPYALRKVFLNDRCHARPACKNGLISRELMYSITSYFRTSLGAAAQASLLQAHVYGGKMLCPTCQGHDLALEDERLEADLLQWQWDAARRARHWDDVKKVRLELGYWGYPRTPVTRFREEGGVEVVVPRRALRSGDGEWEVLPEGLMERLGGSGQAVVVRRPLERGIWEVLKKSSGRWKGEDSAGEKKGSDKGGEEDDGLDFCSICLESIDLEGTGGSVVYLLCGHVHHQRCLGKWFKLQDTCPKCRAKVDGAAVARRAAESSQVG